MDPERRRAFIRSGLALLCAVALCALVLVLRDELRGLERLGYASAFLVPMLSNATVFLPVPGVMYIASLGALYNPFIVAPLAGMGAAVGELTGYMLGYSGKGLLATSDRQRWLTAWLDRNPRKAGLGILVLAAVPNPLFDLAGVAAGTLRIPVWRFYFFCAVGSTIKMAAFALGGYHVGDIYFG